LILQSILRSRDKYGLVRESAEEAEKTGKGAANALGRTKVPRNGTLVNKFRRAGQAPLEIATAGDGDNFYVKVQDVSNSAYKTIFIRGGDTFDTEVPLGNYSIKYAAGRAWYGPQCLFGVETIFKKADYTFEFQQEGHQISGYRIELILQRDGNLSTTQIARDHF
jgi:hypothetical protein